MANVAFTFNLTVTAGDDRQLQFVFSDAAGDPVDITDWDFFYTAKSDVTVVDGSAEISLDPADFTLDDSGSGTTDRATANIPAAATGAMDAGSYVHDLQVKKADGKITTIGHGQLVIVDQVTQRTS